MDPPPDADKTYPVGVTDDTCWLATAANILAGAGYGNGNTVQARAADIYQQLINHFGYDGGWIDTAITWWLTSANNIWPNNRYTVVTVFGNKNPKYPWYDVNGARFIGNELRKGQFVGLSISWPTDAINPSTGQPIIGRGGHAITCWGDNGGNATLTNNPSGVLVTDSDNDTGGDIQNYTYDAFTNPNPGGPNEGNGWYMNYVDLAGDNAYIKHIVELTPTDDPSDDKLTQKVVGSVQIHQSQENPASDLHYEVSTDVDILSYKTNLDWPTTTHPKITESQPRRKISVDWDFKEPIPYCNDVTVTAELTLPSWNSIAIKNLYFTYPDAKAMILPFLRWEIKTPFLEKAERIRNVTGGYVIGSFDIVNMAQKNPKKVVARYRFVHEYSFNQTPEEHVFFLSGQKGFLATNLRFGHSYGYPSLKTLWKFENWMTEIPEWKTRLTKKPTRVVIDWKKRLPYPEGETVYYKIPLLGKGKKYHIKTAKSLDEAMKLLEMGFEYVITYEGTMIFRKTI